MAWQRMCLPPPRRPGAADCAPRPCACRSRATSPATIGCLTHLQRGHAGQGLSCHQEDLVADFAALRQHRRVAHSREDVGVVAAGGREGAGSRAGEVRAQRSAWARLGQVSRIQARLPAQRCAACILCSAGSRGVRDSRLGGVVGAAVRALDGLKGAAAGEEHLAACRLKGQAAALLQISMQAAARRETLRCQQHAGSRCCAQHVFAASSAQPARQRTLLRAGPHRSQVPCCMPSAPATHG